MGPPERERHRGRISEPIDPPGWAPDEFREAYQNWVQQQQFDTPPDPDVFDHAVHLWREAELRYRQCLDRHREHGRF